MSEGPDGVELLYELGQNLEYMWAMKSEIEITLADATTLSINAKSIDDVGIAHECKDGSPRVVKMSNGLDDIRIEADHRGPEYGIDALLAEPDDIRSIVDAEVVDGVNHE